MWVTNANLIVYCSHFLFSWGKRMWMFGMGLFLVRIADDSIQLSASYGLATGLSVFFFGTLVGDWVDNTSRLKAAQLSLAIQYTLMLVCAAVLAVYFEVQQLLQAASLHWLSPLLQAVIVFVGVLSNLAFQTRVIAVERDWVVEICEKNFDHLASMTAMLRRLDLLSMVLAPMACGQVMDYLGLLYGAVFMAVWTLLSLLAELFLTWKVYNIVPALKAMKHSRRVQFDAEMAADQDRIQQTNSKKRNTNSSQQCEDCDTYTRKRDTGDDLNTQITDDTENTNCKIQTTENPTEDSHETTGNEHGIKDHSETEGHVSLDQSQTVQLYEKVQEEAREEHNEVKVTSCLARASQNRVLYQVVTLYRGGRTYMSYSVALPGLSLAFIYMTVLGIDNITVAYTITQGLSESIVGILIGSSAIVGILGTFAYPLIRQRVGLVRTGFISLSCELSVLTLCIVSIWMPGSPFDPLYENTKLLAHTGCVGASDVISEVSTSVSQNATPTTMSFTNSSVFFNTTISANNNTNINATISNTMCDEMMGKRGPDSYMSVIFLLTGIFLGRFGVYMADLSITQLFLEKVVPAERGIVNGVQTSLNQLLDLLKFALVVALPDTETFGFLIIISFCSIATAWVFYTIFVRREGVTLCSVQVCCPGRSSGALEGHDSSGSRVTSHTTAQEGLLEKGLSGDVQFGI